MTQKIKDILLSMRDEDYARFSRKLIPNIDDNKIIGVRMPQLHALVRTLSAEQKESFILDLPHEYQEENILHALIICRISECERCIDALDAFLPFVDNWAVCDCIRPHRLKRQPDVFLTAIRRWLNSSHDYTVRFAVEMLMCYFLDDLYSPEYPKLVSDVASEEYYVNMMLAWYFATALAKQWDSVIGYLQQRKLSPWVHNKTIQKALESYRIAESQKMYLKTLKLR